VHFSSTPTAGSALFLKQEPLGRPRPANRLRGKRRNPEPASVGEARDSDPFGTPEVEEYDPWEPFNEWTFAFNYKLDRYVMKPAAKAWIWAVPEAVRQSLGSAFSNLDTPRRMVNNLLQRKVGGAARETARFLLNSTIGLAALFDARKRAGSRKATRTWGRRWASTESAPGPTSSCRFCRR